MARLRKKHLPHCITITPVSGEGADGVISGTPVTGVHAYVEQRTRLVVDRRSTSATAGQEVTSTTFVVTLPDDEARPGDSVTVWSGTRRERTSQVIDTAFYDYEGTPSHVELFLE